MIHKFVIELTDTVDGYENSVDYFERVYGAEEITDNEIYNQAMECKTDCPCNENGKCTWVANYETCKSKMK